jgi:phosphatidate cytidylyltransferase
MALSNNLTRIIVSVIAIPFILAASYFGKYLFYIFILTISLISYYEFTRMARNKGMNSHLVLGLFGILFFVTNQFKPFFDTYSFILLFIVLVSIIELFRNKNSPLYNLGSTLLGVFYIGFFSSALIGIREFYPDINNLYLRGGYLIISVFTAIWICDSAAYYSGTRLGKNKLFPRVSPNKSWEGAFFGFSFAIISMILARLVILDFLSWQSAIIIGVIIGILGQVGDLIESLFKRDAEVKDSSALIPGHGGIFDRFDSLIFVAPFIFLYLKYFGR